MIDLYTELVGIARAMRDADVPFLLVGGLAYTLLVETRATEDIDLLIKPEDWERTKVTLAPLGYLDLAGPMDFSNIRIRRLTKLDADFVLVADFLLADPPYDKGWERRVMAEVQGVALPVAPPDMIIALKQGRMSAKDRSDIEGLKRVMESSK